MLLHGYRCNLNHIDVSNIANFKGLFKDTDFNGDVSHWDMSNATDVAEMFQRSLFNGDLSQWNMTEPLRCSLFEGMFEGNTAFLGDLSAWVIQDPQRVKGMFDGDYKGGLPRFLAPLNAFADYAELFQNQDDLQNYLASHPFELS